MNAISLFSGIGGIELGLRNCGVRTVAYVEFDPYARAVLLSRMADGRLDRAPLWADVRTFDGHPWRGGVDLIHGGFPCQDLSVAGKRAGITGERSGLWSEFARIVGEVRPRFVFVENVPGLLAGPALGRVLADLAALGFDARWTDLRASDVGAPHRRERIFLLAYRDDGHGQQKGALQAGRDAVDGGGVADAPSARQQARAPGTGHPGLSEGRLLKPERQGGGNVADAALLGVEGDGSGREQEPAISAGEGLPRCDRCGGRGPWCCDPADFPDAEHGRESHGPRQARWQDRERASEREFSGRADGRPAQPFVGRVAHGVPHRVDRLRCLGNAVVPLCAEEAFRRLMQEVTPRQRREKEEE